MVYLDKDEQTKDEERLRSKPLVVPRGLRVRGRVPNGCGMETTNATSTGMGVNGSGSSSGVWVRGDAVFIAIGWGKVSTIVLFESCNAS
jgi:hypothetical protein